MKEIVVSLERGAIKCIYALAGAFFALAASRLGPMALFCFLVTTAVLVGVEEER